MTGTRVPKKGAERFHSEVVLGIALNTAIFSLINDLFLRGAPFSQLDGNRPPLQSCSHVHHDFNLGSLGKHVERRDRFDRESLL
jgi:hypothetical protein